MKLKFSIILFLFPFFINAQVKYSDYFISKSLRFDFILGGNSDTIIVFPQKIKQEPYWGGPKNNLIDKFGYGSYRYRVFDLKSDSLIFSKGFSTLFQEWQATAEAKSVNRTYTQSAVFPYPKDSVRLEIDARQKDCSFKTIYTTNIDPKDYFVLHEKPLDFDIIDIQNNGTPAQKVDLVILAEGYTKAEKQKFIDDTKRVCGYLFNAEPFKTNKNNFNVRAVFTPSLESGTDVPGENIYKNTYFNSTYYTFDVPRYLTTSDMGKVYDAAASVPYDFIYVLVNTERYGGGGFYNFVNLCTADNKLTPQVFVHEFGHGFAGLADEYFYDDETYDDYYPAGVEPWEPNITTMTNFDSKWKSMVNDTVPIPTPRIKKYENVVGVFEGGGYVSKGVYSPSMDCRMKTNVAEGFCPVCRDAVEKVIRFYCGE